MTVYLKVFQIKSKNWIFPWVLPTIYLFCLHRGRLPSTESLSSQGVEEMDMRIVGEPDFAWSQMAGFSTSKKMKEMKAMKTQQKVLFSFPSKTILYLLFDRIWLFGFFWSSLARC